MSVFEEVLSAAKRVAARWGAIREQHAFSEDFGFSKANGRWSSGIALDLAEWDPRSFASDDALCDAAIRFAHTRSWDPDYDEPVAARTELLQALEKIRAAVPADVVVQIDTVDGGLFVIGSSGRDGRVVWRTAAPATAVLEAISATTVLLGYSPNEDTGRVLALDLATGERRFEVTDWYRDGNQTRDVPARRERIVADRDGFLSEVALGCSDLMAGSTRVELIAFDHDGRKLWSVVGHSLRVEALLPDHLEVAGDRGRVTGFDVEDKPVWSTHIARDRERCKIERRTGRRLAS